MSRRTAFNAVDFLRYSLEAPVEYSKQRRSYHYTDPTYALLAVFLREGEVLAILLAGQVPGSNWARPWRRRCRAATDKISRHLPEHVQVGLRDLADGFHISGGNSIEVPLETMRDVQRAIRERRVLHVRYYTAGRDEVNERNVEPHFLTNVRGDWMVVAWDRLREGARVFMLSRIRECAVHDERFSLRPALAPDVYSKDVFLTEHGYEPFDVALRFDSYQARWIRERSWHPSQQLEPQAEPQADGGLVLRLRVSGAGDLLR